ncbi:MAG: carbon-nitrogen hydrolase family protein [Clostridia bacterium]|nr:carbon-nitrogen hydrolase family protein [Clostridia bacterium]
MIRPVRIASIAGPRENPDAFFDQAEKAAKQRPDLIVLPEMWQPAGSETIEGDAITRLCAVARDNGCYIIHPTLLLDAGKRYNTALLIDRGGAIAGRYDKRYPYWEEFSPDGNGLPCAPGEGAGVFDCDFGRIAIRICFDANFPELWSEAAKHGAELVIWPSAYAAGTQLAAHALNHHFPIVTSTLTGNCMVFDINGERIVNVRSDSHFTQWVTLDLDRCIFHENYNEDKLAMLLAENPGRVGIEKRMPDEQWIIVRSASDGVSARDVCRDAGMEELRRYKERSKKEIDAMR